MVSWFTTLFAKKKEKERPEKAKIIDATEEQHNVELKSLASDQNTQKQPEFPIIKRIKNL